LKTDKSACKCSVGTTGRVSATDCTCATPNYSATGDAYKQACATTCAKVSTSDADKNMWSSANGLAKCTCGDSKFWKDDANGCEDCPSGATCDGTNITACSTSGEYPINSAKACGDPCPTSANGAAVVWNTTTSACECPASTPKKSGSAGSTACAVCDPVVSDKIVGKAD